MELKLTRISNDLKWGELLLLSNEEIELQIPLSIGPRITSFRFLDGENIFYEAPDVRKHFGSNNWFPYGGHRLWHAPEQNPRSYYPDNQPVSIVEEEGFVEVAQEVERTTGIQKKVCINFGSKGNNVRIDHILTNQGLWPIDFAGWSLSVLDKGGKAVIPLPEKIPFPEMLLPRFPVVVWPYTDLSDPRLSFSERYIHVSQLPGAKSPLKIGIACEMNWAGYFIRDALFVKRFQFQTGHTYPDFGSNVEVYTDSEMLELETLSPIQKIESGDKLIYSEDWELWRSNGVPESDEEIDTIIQKYHK
jgi:hypothetical protein